MSLGEDLRSYLIENENILAVFPDIAEAGKLQQNKIDQGVGNPKIWFIRSGTEQVLFYGGEVAQTITRFDFEVISVDIDEALNISEVVKSELQGFSGLMGESHVELIEVEDYDDDYFPKNDTDEGLNISAIKVSVYT